MLGTDLVHIKKLIFIDDIDVADGVVFQSLSLGDFWIVRFSILRGSLVSGQDWRFVLLFEALNTFQSLAGKRDESQKTDSLWLNQ